MERRSVLDGRDGGVLGLKRQGHFFVMDIMAKTTCWLLMTVWLSGRISTQKWDEGGEGMSFSQQTAENDSSVVKMV